MKPIKRILQEVICIFLFTGCNTTLVSKEYADYVNPFIGTGGHGHTFPGATVPHGMIQPSPDTRIYGWDACSGYHYSDTTINGFSHTHLSGTGCGDYGDILLMPITGKPDIHPVSAEEQTLPFASRFSHQNEIATPGYYSVFLDTYQIKAELTATARAAIHRYTFPENQQSGFILDLDYSLQGQRNRELSMTIVNDSTICGHKNTNGWAWKHDIYFYAVFSKPFQYTIIEDSIQEKGKQSSRLIKKALLQFATQKDEQVLVKIALSAVDCEGARKNLEEIPDWDFEHVKSNARKEWNNYLSKIDISTQDENSKTVFYTAMYHTALAPNLFTDRDGRYRGIDRKIHTTTADKPIYTIFSLWDTFRALHPLMTIIDPELNNHFINTLLQQYKEGGFLPMWELAGNYTGTMPGYHAIPVITDAWIKGYHDFDLHLALKACRRSAEYDTLSPIATTDYLKHNALMPISKYYKNTLGYIPCDKEYESVAKGLEYAYNDWCISLLAEAAGDSITQRRYEQLGKAYRHYFDSSVGFMRGKDINGKWRTPFSPRSSNHREDDYCEGTAWQWTWFVPHDVDGLIDLLGGRQAFIDKLDSLFTADSSLEGELVSADISGLIGQYAHGNEPSHHIIHLYNHVGQPWKTQRLTDSVLHSQYFNDPNGLSGNEDCGQMSAWYVLNAMGFYQPCPGRPEYSISRPLFDSVTINLPAGKTFRIITENNSRSNKYILSATLNGETLPKPYFTHKQLTEGGVLKLVMTSRPCDWNSVQSSAVIPVPLKEKKYNGSFQINGNTRLYTNLQGEERKCMEKYLSTLPSPFNKGFSDKINSGNTIFFEKTDTSLAPESYTLKITAERITVQAGDDAGLFYGLQTLLQSLTATGKNSYTVQSAEIEDSPRFQYRGFMIDVSRHFRTKEFIKKQIDAMARYKLNRLHLHLTDAAGWRIEIKEFPRLTQFAAWRPEAVWKKWWFGENGRRYCEESDPQAQGGYYTKEDIKDLVEYAACRHITIIPEIEMPAHSDEVLAAYPELSCTGQPYQSGDFCIGNEKTFQFLEKVLAEVMEMFPSEYIHIGGDEAGKQQWKTCSRCLARMEQENLKNVDELQSYLIHRIEVFLNAHGRKLLGWDEIMQGGLAPNATVMSWRGEEGGIRAAQTGHQAIMTPGSHCYFDNYQDAPFSQPEAIGGYLPLQKVYAYNPIPASFNESQAQFIYGVQANLWAEYITTDEHYEYMTYPRLLALAEVAWSTPERKCYENFYPRALKAVEWLQKQGYHPFPLEKEIGQRPESQQTVNHLALHKPVIYNAPYHNAYPAQGDKTLTDGKRGDWTYSDGAWQGFISKKRLDVTVDLEKDTEIHSIYADFIQVVGPEVFLPVEVIISVSSDGKTFSEMTRITHSVDKSQSVDFKQFGWQGNTHARYIRYQAVSGKEYGGWIFTDEIIVR